MQTADDIFHLIMNGIIYVHTVFFIAEFVKILQHMYNNLSPIQIVLYASSVANHLYDKYDAYAPQALKSWVGHTGYLVQWTAAKWGNYRIEPQSPPWVCIYWRTEKWIPFASDDSAKFQSIEYHDVYHVFSVTVNLIRNIEKLISIITPSFYTKEVMITIAKPEKRITRILYQSPDTKDESESFRVFEFFKKVYTVLEGILLAKKSKRSKAPFLAVSYTNLCMPGETVDLQIPADDWFENNEILSYTYVMRLLEYQPNRKVIVNDEYVVVIIDSDIKTVELRSNQFIRLGTQGYEIITL